VDMNTQFTLQSDIKEMSERVRARKISPVEIVSACLMEIGPA